MGEAALKLKPLSSEDYLREEVTRALKHEYLDGQVYALAGASDHHNRVLTNLTGHLWLATRRGSCQTYSSGMKLRVQTELTERFYYPDVMVTCSEGDIHELYKSAPCLLVEVTCRVPRASTAGKSCWRIRASQNSGIT